MGTSWHLLCYKRCQLVPSSDTCLVGYELTSDGGTSWHLLVVRADMGTSWHGYELTSIVWWYMATRTIILYLPCWVRVDIICGTSWHHLWYKLTSVGGTSWHGYELTWVRVDMGRVDMGTSWLSPIFTTYHKSFVSIICDIVIFFNFILDAKTSLSEMYFFSMFRTAMVPLQCWATDLWRKAFNIFGWKYPC